MYIVYVHVGMSYASFKQTRAPTRDDFFLRWQEPAAWLQGPFLPLEILTHRRKIRSESSPSDLWYGIPQKHQENRILNIPVMDIYDPVIIN